MFFFSVCVLCVCCHHLFSYVLLSLSIGLSFFLCIDYLIFPFFKFRRSVYNAIQCKMQNYFVKCQRYKRREQKGVASLLIWKITKPIFIFSKRRVQMDWMMNQYGKVNLGGGGKILFPHGKHHSNGVCILFDPTVNSNVECFFSNNTGRIDLRVCPWENQAGGDTAQITDFAQT